MQSLFAMGSGGVFGVGIGKSIQKNLHLPEAQNDFILAIIGEELGFIGIILLLLAYLVLIWKGFEIAMNAKDSFGTLLACGITSMLAIQVTLNVLVTTSSMPPTGVTLPFVSYGGNALLLFMASMGILLNISRVSRRQPARSGSRGEEKK
jgi:cell division protein FtsW